LGATQLRHSAEDVARRGIVNVDRSAGNWNPRAVDVGGLAEEPLVSQNHLRIVLNLGIGTRTSAREYSSADGADYAKPSAGRPAAAAKRPVGVGNRSAGTRVGWCVRGLVFTPIG